MELHPSHHQALVIAIEFIHLKGMLAAFHQKAGFVYHAWFTEFEYLLCLIEGYFLFKLISAHSFLITGALDSKVSPVATDTYPYSTAVTTQDIALFDATAVISLTLIIITPHQEFPFYFQSAHQIT